MAVKKYDVLIVGSGHSGGMAANILTQKGISCLMLNAAQRPTMRRTAASNMRMSCHTEDSISRAGYPMYFRPMSSMRTSGWTKRKCRTRLRRMLL